MSKCFDQHSPGIASVSRVGCYNIGRTIGKGNFAVVKAARHDVTKSKVAIKVIDKNKIDDENMRKIYREIAILKTLRHPHIVTLYQVMESESKLFLVTEYAGGGEVFEYLRKHNKMCEREARNVFRQIVSAVAYCHSMRVVHRDLKAENILFSKNMNVKLVDFGFSNYADEHTLLKTWCGSPPYAAPELFLGEKYCGQKSDIWSLGVILYILVCGGFPFPSSSIDRLRHAVLEGHISIPFYVSSECADLIRRMLVVNAKLRLSMQQIIQHRWFTANDWDQQWADLFSKSLNPYSPCFDELSINYACVAYMQQRGCTADKVVESLSQRRFDDDYATYQLLCDKLAKISFQTAVGCNGVATFNPGRRGSRGSITTGKVDDEMMSDVPLISSIELAQLGMSSSDEDGASGESDDGVAAAAYSAAAHSYLSQRRHTAIGVPVSSAGFVGAEMLAATPALASASGIVALGGAGLNPVPYPLNFGAALGILPPQPQFFLSPRVWPDVINQRTNSSTVDTAIMNEPFSLFGPPSSLLPPIASPFISCLPTPAGPYTFGHAVNAAVEQQPSTATEAMFSVEEAGANYLKSRSNTKRHTIHSGVIGRGDFQSSSSAGSSAAAGGGGGKHARQHLTSTATGGVVGGGRYRTDPYARRSTPLAPAAVAAAAVMTTPSIDTGGGMTNLTPDALRHLERLYQNAIGRADSPAESMRHLQQEFQQLRPSVDMSTFNPPGMTFSGTSNAISCDVWRPSPRSSPPGGQPPLDIIAEHESDDQLHVADAVSVADSSPSLPYNFSGASIPVGRQPTTVTPPPPTIQITTARNK